jgi:hypothetical protein
MAPLRLIAGVMALFAASAALGASAGRWRPLVAEASARFGVPSSWIVR